MARLRSLALLLGLVAGLVVWGGVFGDDTFGDDEDTFDFDESLVHKWHEGATSLPPYPRDEDLVAAHRFAPNTLTLLVDRRSISVGQDRVIRLTYVMESDAGSRNVFYEGFRCGKGVYKTYAFGTANRHFEPVKHPQWRPIPNSTLNNFRRELYGNLLCRDFGVPRQPKEVLDQLDRLGEGGAG
jgi:hypothetical protein